MGAKLVFATFIVFFSQTFVAVSSTTRPIIGIVAQEIPDEWKTVYRNGSSYIAASYVKAVEASGARVVPILTNQSESYYRKLLSSVNGVVFPGGESPFEHGHGYYDAISTIYKITKELNDKGHYFPILAICLGYEAMLTVANNDTNIQTECDIFYENYPLIFLPTYKNSLLFSNVPESIFISLKYFDVTINNHYRCITPENFTKSALPQEWIVTTDTVSRKGLLFISSVEHIKYPFIGLQFHPEKAMFEWKRSVNITHTTFSIHANRYFYDTLIRQAKLNDNKFKSEKSEDASLIYNYAPVYSESHTLFEQIYVF